jgi:hypothetical protein
MKSHKLGKNISEVEVQEISKQGIWLYVKGREYLLPYEEFPWFKGARISELYKVQLVRGRHLHWPSLDVDLELESLQYPEKYPLVYQSKS